MAKKTEILVTKEPKRKPTHPGKILQKDILPALDLSVSDAAKLLRVTRQTLHKIMAEKMAVTPEMAMRLGKFCGNGAALWLNLQNTYDLWNAKQSMDKELQKIPSYATCEMRP
ncbi:MAG: addiction module antidote protein, HigA family [Alphaproteobacteria bacterium]|nr:addiction module antidote protein, HigA family [Alphaproteobacteria bacterium]